MKDNVHKDKGGFSLVEMMIVVSILLVIVGMALLFYGEHLKAGFVSENKNIVNSGIRKMTQEMIGGGKSATYFTVYNSYAASDWSGSLSRLAPGSAGDFVVFVYSASPIDYPTGVRPIERIVGYYKDTSTGQVLKFDKSFNPAASGSVESLIPSSTQASTFRTITNQISSLGSGKLFYNQGGKSVIVSGNIIQGNVVKPVTGAYSFSITPRG